MGLNEEGKRNLGRLGFLLLCIVALALIDWIAIIPFGFGYVIAMVTWGQKI